MKNKKWFIYARVILLWWALLCGLLWLAAPILLQLALQKYGSEWLGRRIEVGQIEVRPGSLEIALHDLQVANSDGTAGQFFLRRVYLNAELQSLLHFAPVIQAIQIDQPVLHVTHWGDGRYDLDDVVSKWIKPSDDTAPARFALYNLEVTGGAVIVQDHLSSGAVQTHRLSDLHLTLPFISNFQAYQSVHVEPKIAFQFNNVPFDSEIRSTVFDAAPSGSVALRIKGLDLSTYSPYWPASLPVRLQQGVLDLDTRIDFTQSGDTPRVQLSGQIGLSGLQLADSKGATTLQLGTMQLAMTDVRPLERSAQLSRLFLDAPVAYLDRVSLLKLLHSQRNAATEQSGSSTAWRVELAQLQMQDGALHWLDTTVQPRAQLALHDVKLNAQNIVWPANRALQAQGSLSVVEESQRAAKRVPAARLQWDGAFSLQQASLNLDLQTFDFRLAAPYLAAYLQPKLRGVVDANMQWTWQPDSLDVKLAHVTVKDFSLQHGTVAMPRFKALELRGGALDFAKQQIQLQSLQLVQPSVPLERDENGRWAFLEWIKLVPGSANQPAAASKQPWRVTIDQATVRQGAVTLEDRAVAKPVKLALSQLQIQLKQIHWLGNHIAPGWMPVSVSANVQSGRMDPGSVQYQGRIQAHPHWLAEGRYNLRELPLHALYPYFADRWNVDVMRADASAQGQVRLALLNHGMQLALRTDALLEDVRVVATPVVQSANHNPLGLSRELLRWKMLRIPGLTLRIEPGSPLHLNVDEVIWSDFFARLVVQSNGRLNLQDLLKPVPVAKTDTPVPEHTPVTEPSQPAQIELGPIRLERGTVQFTDLFIQPNYSTDLTDLQGSLSELSSLRRADGQVGLAQLALTGKAEGTAQLQIAGKLNPLVQPVVLDIQAKMDDLELSPLSAYSAKYAGYGIERGKLDVDLQYNIAPDGALRAINRIVLNQLTFGDKVPDSSASLPVKLAVALLQDSRGVIDVNLPITGSINDPQFRLGPIIFQVVVNLIKKAVTAPFTLLASVFSGDSKGPSTVDFAAGSSVLQADAQQVLNKLVQAMQQRPGVIVTLTGSADAEREQAALRRTELHKMMLREHLRQSKVIVGQPQPVTEWSSEQYAAVLKSVYRRADMDKPRNLVGMLKDLSVTEMEDLLLANIPVTEEKARDLALARSMAVKDYLLSQNIPSQRVFLGAAKVTAPDVDWTPSVEMGVALP